jgi:hypothetical protein
MTGISRVMFWRSSSRRYETPGPSSWLFVYAFFTQWQRNASYVSRQKLQAPKLRGMLAVFAIVWMTKLAATTPRAAPTSILAALLSIIVIGYPLHSQRGTCVTVEIMSGFWSVAEDDLAQESYVSARPETRTQRIYNTGRAWIHGKGAYLIYLLTLEMV